MRTKGKIFVIASKIQVGVWRVYGFMQANLVNAVLAGGVDETTMKHR